MKRFDAFSHPLHGAHLIEASAGTGKTYNITLLVLRLIVEQGISIDELLVVTFTEAATHELKEKIFRRLIDAYEVAVSVDDSVSVDEAEVYRKLFERHEKQSVITCLKQAIRNFDRARVFTIHGFCQRVLGENAFETGMEMGIELTPKNDPFFLTLAKDFWLAYCYGLPPFMVSYFLNNHVSVSSFAALAKKVYATPKLQIVTGVYAEDAQETFLTIYTRCRELFFKYKDELSDIFAASKGINRNSYKKTYIPKWIDKANDLFLDETPTFVPDKEHEVFRFSTRRIWENAKDTVVIEQIPLFAAVDRLHDAAQQMQGEVEKARRIFVEFVRTVLPERKQKNGLLFFDDLLQRLDSALQGNSRNLLVQSVSRKYRAALIDEFQDTDAVQYRIFKQLFMDVGIPFFMIGDPKQAIYSFRGGDIFTYMNASAAVAESTVSLDTNWRSTETLVTAVNELFKLRDNPFLFEMLRFHPVSASVRSGSGFQLEGEDTSGFQFLFCRRSGLQNGSTKTKGVKQIAANKNIHIERTCSDIVDMLSGRYTIDGKRVEPSDIAVLVRKNSHGREIHNALARRNVLSVVSGTESVYSTVAATEFFQILCAIDSCEISSIKAAVSTYAFGIKGDRLVEFAADTAVQGEWEAFFLELKNTYSENGLVAMSTKLILKESVEGDGGMKARVLSEVSDARYLVDFMHLIELQQKEYSKIGIPFEQIVDGFERRLGDPTETDECMRRPIQNTGGVQIVTIHKSKGLQYPVVYLPYAWNDGYRSSNDFIVYHRHGHDGFPTGSVSIERAAQSGPTEIDADEVCDLRVSPDDEAVSLHQREQKSEQLRLLYVALTRAKHVCKIVWGGFSGVQESSLGYLLYEDSEQSIKTYSDSQLLLPLERFCSRCGATIDDGDRSKVDAILDERYQKNSRALSFREFVPELQSTKKVLSFSALVHMDQNAFFDKVAEGERIEENERNVNEDFVDIDERLSGTGSAWKGLIHDFGRGTSFGSFVHDVFENYFRHGAESGNISRLVSQLLPKYGFETEHWASHVETWFSDVIRCFLDASHSFCLQTVAANCIPEMEFVVPVNEQQAFSVASLQRAMQEDATGFFLDYSMHLQSMSFHSFYGYLKGFIDLIFVHEGKYFIADYKTNDLGKNSENYLSENLHADMSRHHYFLQYHIYLVALHRYLQSTVPDYRYDSHVGGVFYLYVRGMTSLHDNKYGVFFDRPTENRILALDRLLARNDNQ
ncbi:MAG: exodeoxyribonuclease V subunit beta [Deltaproteobacteria bacterium]|nr:exodeoxyribonuclease V subunit beta [Deltaproteobacteria bacterium]MBN2672429.1 exodeoxyribonuclease V subunit beta [Deltaproteobacteria bacterium]